MQSDKANDYVQLFESIRSRVGNDDVALAIVEQLGKDHRVEQMRNGRSGSFGVNGTNGSSEQAATEKQIAFLRDLGVSVPAGLTKVRASELIDAAQEQALAA